MFNQGYNPKPMQARNPVPGMMPNKGPNTPGMFQPAPSKTQMPMQAGAKTPMAPTVRPKMGAGIPPQRRA